MLHIAKRDSLEAHMYRHSTLAVLIFTLFAVSPILRGGAWTGRTGEPRTWLVRSRLEGKAG